jgi:hypothetical protein
MWPPKASFAVPLKSAMNHLKETVFSILLVAIAVPGSELANSLDLERLLGDSAAFGRLVIEYEPGDDTVLLVYGAGRVVKQPRPRFSSNNIVPTCTGRVDQDEIREVVRALINRHFFDLPSRSYVYRTVSNDDDEFWKALKLHSITIDDGKTRASRQFADGIYYDRKQTLPRTSSR